MVRTTTVIPGERILRSILVIRGEKVIPGGSVGEGIGIMDCDLVGDWGFSASIRIHGKAAAAAAYPETEPEGETESKRPGRVYLHVMLPGLPVHLQEAHWVSESQGAPKGSVPQVVWMSPAGTGPLSFLMGGEPLSSAGCPWVQERILDSIPLALMN